MSVDNETARDLQLIVANLHWRYSGVTATSRMVTPRLAKMFRTVWFGPDAPDGVTCLRFPGLLKLRRQQTPVIWHARRNNDMMAGVLLKAFGWPLRLLFTSAAQRHHTWITRWLISRMDAVILVVNAGQTRRGAIRHTVELLRRTRARIVGAVFNKVDAKKGGYYYYYYKGDGYYSDASTNGHQNGKGKVLPELGNDEQNTKTNSQV